VLVVTFFWFRKLNHNGYNRHNAITKKYEHISPHHFTREPKHDLIKLPKIFGAKQEKKKAARRRNIADVFYYEENMEETVVLITHIHVTYFTSASTTPNSILDYVF